MSHTPGPWTLQNADDSDPWNLGSMWVTDASARVLIADPENNDDARLIAAAPDLLAALRSVAATSGAPTSWEHDMACQRALGLLHRLEDAGVSA